MNKKLHILFLCGWYPSRILPTNGDFIERHAKAVSLQHKVTVFHIISDEKATKKIEIESKNKDGIDIHIAYLKDVKNPLLKAFLFLKAYKMLLKKVDNFDLIHLNEVFPFGVFSLFTKLFQKKPYIISEHWTDYKFPLSKNIASYQKYISKIITKNASFVCPVTTDLKESMLSFGLKGNYEIVENVVDTDKFYPKEIKSEHFKIVHISNMNDDHKNISGILNVVSKIQKKIPNLQFIMIGDNAMQYKALSDKLKIESNKINFINHIPHHQIITHLQEANLFVLFSNYENLPCVILESFACGTPVITSDVGGIKEYFPENFGSLIAAKDEQKLEEKILSFYNKKEEFATKTTMYDFIKNNFSEKVILKKFNNLYSKSLGQ